MSYSTIDNIKTKLSTEQIADLSADDGSGVIDNDNVNAAISRADSIIDSYLRGRFTLPLAEIPVELTHFSSELVIFELYDRKLGGMVPDEITKRRSETLAALREVQKGIRVLFEQVDPVSIRVRRTSDRVFTAQTFDDFRGNIR